MSVVFDEMLAFAQTISSSSSLSDPSSPQYKAVEWLTQDKIENGSNWSGYELLQRYVLRVLYHSTDGTNWGGTRFDYDTRWFRASPVCDWPSTGDLFCDTHSQQVNYLNLEMDNLQGSLPDELGAGLTALTLLMLSDNQLTSTIPTQLGQQLTALTHLDLSFNRLTGTIPDTLTQLTDLNHLRLDNNRLTGPVPAAFCAAPFPNWKADGEYGAALWADCLSEIQCDCCDLCF